MSFRFVDSRPAQPSPRATLVGKLPRCLSYVSYFVVTFVVFATWWKAPVLELPHFPTINQRRKRCIYKVRSFREFEFNKLIRGSCFFFVCEGVVSLSFCCVKGVGVCEYKMIMIFSSWEQPVQFLTFHLLFYLTWICISPVGKFQRLFQRSFTKLVQVVPALQVIGKLFHCRNIVCLSCSVLVKIDILYVPLFLSFAVTADARLTTGGRSF